MHGTILYAVGISSLKGLKENQNQRERLSKGESERRKEDNVKASS